MSNWLEVVMPVRNPGDKFMESIRSLATQTSRNFGVLISDNFSTQGVEFIEAARLELENAGIDVRVVQPPYELGRVEHWNWAHAASNADWMKPLFAGDLIATTYVAQLRERILANPLAHVARCEFTFTTETGVITTTAPGSATKLTREEFLRYFPQDGNWMGGPINFAYSRQAWMSLGGYSPQLPSCADYNLYVSMILRYGVELIRESLATFQLHAQRFSHGIRGRRVNACFEVWVTLRQARNYCLNVGLPWPRHGVARGTWKQIEVDYWAAWKAPVSRLLRRR